jgi:hypothetical protein
VIAAALACGPLSARAAEVTRLYSGSRAKGELPDVGLGLAWLREERTAVVGRELQDAAAGGRTVLVKDLIQRQTRNLLQLHANIGLFHDLGLFVAAPFVISDDRSLSFDRRDDACRTATPGGAASTGPRCIDENNSTLLRDGIVPGAGMASYGLDAEHERPFARPSEMVFRGPTRRGLEYLGVGVAWAPMSQARDPEKPNWVLRFESRLAVTEAMRFDPAKPKANTAVGPGYHQFIFSTLFSRRFSRFDPYVGGSYLLPVAGSSSPFEQFPLGTEGFGGPQHRATAEAGVELVAYENARFRQRVTLELRGHMELRFFGLARSELWEALAGRSTCPEDPGSCRRDVDRDVNGDGTIDANPGITRSPGYGVFGGAAGINVQMGRYFRFRGLFGLTREQDRFISDGRSGNESYDLPGRRFRVQDAGGWNLQVDGGLLF